MCVRVHLCMLTWVCESDSRTVCITFEKVYSYSVKKENNYFYQSEKKYLQFLQVEKQNYFSFSKWPIENIWEKLLNVLQTYAFHWEKVVCYYFCTQILLSCMQLNCSRSRKIRLDRRQQKCLVAVWNVDWLSCYSFMIICHGHIHMCVSTLWFSTHELITLQRSCA